MKRLMVAMVAVLVFASAATAGTVSLSGVTSSKNPLVVNFTSGAGTVTATASVSNAKRTSEFVMHITELSTGRVLCTDPSPQPLSCSAVVTGGAYSVDVYPLRGGGTYTVTGTISTP